MKNNIYIDWEEYDILLTKLVDKIKEKNDEYTGVYGIPRGGLPVALYISHHLNIPLLKKPKDKCIICDDISDTGKTSMKKKYKEYSLSCLFSTGWTKRVPDFFVDEKKSKRDWIVFPYEMGEE